MNFRQIYLPQITITEKNISRRSTRNMLLTFILLSFPDEMETEGLFQKFTRCPTADYAHFYATLFLALEYQKEGDNALRRALPISAFCNTVYIGNHIHHHVCQCPTSGFTHFYESKSKTDDFSLCFSPKFAHIFETGSF